MEEENEEFVLDENSELYKALREDEVEIEQEHAEQEAFFLEMEELYDAYKKRLADPAFQEYQREVVRRATRRPDNAKPMSQKSENADT